jgi:putative transposase
MIDRDHEVSLARQAELLGISRGSAYYVPKPVPDSDLALMRRIDELHLEHPFMGARLLRDTLNREGLRVGRRHVATLMARMGIEALYRRPRTTQKHPAHKVYPYLLRGLTIDQPNRVWALDITYIPMARGFVYLCVVLDWASRKALAHRVSICMDASFCVEALEEALRRHGPPDIVNTDQGSQFTSAEFIKALTDRNLRISMDGKGAWRDNVFVERLWRTVKYEEVYLKAYDSVREARESIARYLDFYNTRRPHSSLDSQTPDEVYFKSRPALPKAA